MSKYKDVLSISDWSETPMKWAVGQEIIEGIDESRLDPKGYATRAQVAKILMKYIESVK